MSFLSGNCWFRKHYCVGIATYSFACTDTEFHQPFSQPLLWWDCWIKPETLISGFSRAAAQRSFLLHFSQAKLSPKLHLDKTIRLKIKVCAKLNCFKFFLCLCQYHSLDPNNWKDFIIFLLQAGLTISQSRTKLFLDVIQEWLSQLWKSSENKREIWQNKNIKIWPNSYNSCGVGYLLNINSLAAGESMNFYTTCLTP